MTNHYATLGVSRDADHDEIKRAYRRLARQHHPDANREDPEAEERFKEVTRAYEVLSDPDKRQRYDLFGDERAASSAGGFGGISDLFEVFFGGGSGSGGRGGGTTRGADVLAEVEIDLREAATGATRMVPFPVATTCARCGGSGAQPGTAPERCPRCGGSGRLQSVSSSLFGQVVRAHTCPDCGGSGSVVRTPCEACGGTGRISEERTLEVEIPPGIHDGQRIRLTGEGHAGMLGGRAGDVYVLVRVRPDDRFVREGNDVISTVTLTMTEAALGARVAVPTLEGDVELDFPPGTQPGEVRVLRGKGMPVLQALGRGDHRLLVNVAIPRHLSEEQRGLLEEFQGKVRASNYRRDEGLFEKLRAAFR